MSAALSSSSRVLTRAVRALPVQRHTTRQMSSAHGPPDPWPYTPEESKRFYGYGIAVIGISAAIHLSMNNPFASKAKPAAAVEAKPAH